MILNLLKNGISIEFYKFIVVGIWSTIINYGVFYFLLDFFSVNYLIASAIGFMFGVFVGYRFNRKWTFKVEKQKNYIEVTKYYSVYIFSLMLSLFFLRVTVGVFDINPKIANILAIGVTTFTNFIGIKLVVFKK